MTAIVARIRRGSIPIVAAYVGTSVFALAAGRELVRLGTFHRQLRATLLGAALVATAAVVVYPELAFPAILAIAPFEFKMRLAGHGAGTTEVMALGIALVIAPRLRPRSTPRWARAGFACVVLGSLVAAVSASVPGEALWGAVRWLAVGVIALGALQYFGEREDASRRAVDILSCTAIVVAAFGVLQRQGIYWVVGAPYESDRVNSTFGFYTNFAGFMMVALLASIGAGVDARARGEGRRVALHAATTLATGLGLGISLSRGALLGAAVGLVTLIALNVRNPRRVLGIIATLSVFALAVWFTIPASARTEFQQRLSEPVASSGDDQEHLALSAIGESALLTHPIGLGYGNFAAYQIATDQLVAGQTFFHSQRLPVQVGLDAGWLGLFGFGLLSCVPLAAAVRAARGRLLSPTAAGLAAAMVAFLAQGWFDYLFDELSCLILFGALSWAIWHAVHVQEAVA